MVQTANKVRSFFTGIYDHVVKAWMDQLQHMGYQDMGALAESLAPSLKYPGLTLVTLIASNFSVPLIKIFGLNEWAFAAVCITFGLELLTGRWAARARGESMQSSKAIRFSFKLFFYLSIIFLTYQLSQNYTELDNGVGKVIFEYAHLFCVIEIVYENWISIRENIGDISEKSDWIVKLRDKLRDKL